MPLARILSRKPFSFAGIALELCAESWTPPAAYEAHVQKLWAQRLAETRTPLWDGNYYRLLDLAAFDGENSPSTFRLGHIRYRYLATAARLQKQALELGLSPLQHLSTIALLRTTDGFFLFGQRARNGATEPIGGGVQSDELPVATGADLEKNLRKEIAEETGISGDEIESLEGLGFLLAENTNVLAVGEAHLRLTRAEAEMRFAQRLEAEMSRPLFVAARVLRDFLRTLPDYRALLAELALRPED